MMAHTHDVETMKEKTAYRNHINSEIEIREVFEQETSNRNIENIVTRLDKTLLDNNQMTRLINSSKHSETYKLGSNRDSELSSSDLSESLSSDSRARKKKRTKKKNRREHQKYDSSDLSSRDDSDSSNDSNYRRKQ